MSQDFDLARRAFPSRVADLGFSIELPRDWVEHDLPGPDGLDFDDPTVFAPLAVVTAPHSALVFAFAARPAYGDGTLHDWSLYLLGGSGLEPRAIGEHTVGVLPAIVGEAVQDSEMGPMRVRFAFCEDGGRLINLTLSAPEVLEEVVRHLWFDALASFELQAPRGSTVALFPPVEAVVVGAEKAWSEADDADELEAGTEAEAGSGAPATADASDWLSRAQALERANKLEEAEELIMSTIDHIGAAATVAQMYADRARRLSESGDDAGAEEAHGKAVQWIRWYASLATSGGEGAALSRERDQFLRALGEEV